MKRADSRRPRPISSTAWIRKRRAAARTGRKACSASEFLSKYKHSATPMAQLGSFVYSRTYSRYHAAAQSPRVLVGDGAPCSGIQLLARADYARGGGGAFTTTSSTCASSSPDGRCGWAATPVSHSLSDGRITTAPLRSSTITTPTTICSIC